MAKKTPNTPLSRVKTSFGSKKDLVQKVKDLATAELWTDRLNDDKSWESISNAKLLRLHRVLGEVKERFGSREKLVDELSKARGHGKDKDYRTHFATWPLPRLLDALNSAERSNKRAAKKAAAKKPATAAAKPAKKPAKTKPAAT